MNHDEIFRKLKNNDDLFKNNGIPKEIFIGGKEYKINPEAIIFFQLGLDKLLQDDYSGAIIEFTKAIKGMPTNQNLYIYRGYSFEALGNDFEAEKDFRKTLEFNPIEVMASFHLAMVFYRKKEFDTAAKWLKVSYDNHLGIDLEHQGYESNSIFNLSKKVVACNLGNSLAQMGKFEEGIKYLDEAIKMDQNYSNPNLTKGLILVELGKVNEGLIFIKKAEQLGNLLAKNILQKIQNR